MNTMKNINFEALDKKAINMGLLVFIAFVSFIILFYVMIQIQKKDKNCKTIEEDYENSSSITSINFSNDDYTSSLHDYYVLGAYNCCVSGSNKNDYVDVCALKSCIKNGFRFLDFKIYNKDGEPIIASGSKDSVHYKETYNYVPISTALETVKDRAFMSDNCPNPNDPLFLYFRIISNEKVIYEGLASAIKKYLSEYMMSSQGFSNESSGKNITSLKLKQFTGRVIIIVDKTNENLFNNSSLKEVTNLTTGPNSPFVRKYKISDITSMSDYTDLIQYNRVNMSIVTPDNQIQTNNYNASSCFSSGCQFICMNAQTMDNEMAFMYEKFNGSNCAFILKPEPLRSVKVTIGPFYTENASSASCEPKERTLLIGSKEHTFMV